MHVNNPVTITESALKEVRQIMQHKGIPENYGLRIGIKGAGCAGLGFLIGFDIEKEDDISYQIDDITVLIHKKHTMYVIGLQVDFYEGADARGFTFENPELKEAASD